MEQDSSFSVLVLPLSLWLCLEAAHGWFWGMVWLFCIQLLHWLWNITFLGVLILPSCYPKPKNSNKCLDLLLLLYHISCSNIAWVYQIAAGTKLFLYCFILHLGQCWNSVLKFSEKREVLFKIEPFLQQSGEQRSWVKLWLTGQPSGTIIFTDVLKAQS